MRDKDFHGKSFLFKNKKKHTVIIGSSNLTENGLSKNLEINIQVTGNKNSKIVNDIIDLHNNCKKFSVKLNDKIIKDYEKLYKEFNFKNLIKSKDEFVVSDSISQPNSMQVEAIENLEELRLSKKNKAIVISATGTGKTVMSAFDVLEMGAKKLLFVVHRRNIAIKAMDTFKEIFKKKRSYGLFSGDTRETNKDFIFSTVQTVNNPDHFKKFKKNYFDYIIIDETHRAAAKTYQRILNYFKPKFLLGMTATPERTDGFDIFSYFDHNIAYEIRLNKALDEDLLIPFHYLV